MIVKNRYSAVCNINYRLINHYFSCDCRLSSRRKLVSSVALFVAGVLMVSSLLTSIVDSDMYGGPVGTGEDYYYSWGAWNVNLNDTSAAEAAALGAAADASVSSSPFGSSAGGGGGEPQAVNVGLIMVNTTNNAKLLNNFKVCICCEMSLFGFLSEAADTDDEISAGLSMRRNQRVKSSQVAFVLFF
jgi:hypothetical protein